MKRPIAISLAPNMQNDDIWVALKMLLSPINWMNFRKTEELERRFALTFGKNYHALAINSGRSALYLILKTLGVKEGDYVALQALTCVNVPNSITWLKASPLYVDVDKNFNMNFNDLNKKITENTKAIIVQHSFGIPADIDKIMSKIKKRNVILIEDCALSLGAKYKGKPVGTLGDVSFFSFGRDKVLSSVFGGMILTRNKVLFNKLKTERDKLSYPSLCWVLQQLIHPVLFSVILPTYNIGYKKITLGKTLLFLSQKLRLITKPVSDAEKNGLIPKYFPTKMPGALSALALNQLKKLNYYNSHRIRISEYYRKSLQKYKIKVPNSVDGAIWMRFPLVINNAREILEYFKKRKILLGDWYGDVVVPVNDLKLAYYKRGICPEAEKIAGNIINLPTYPGLTLEDAKKVIEIFVKCQKNI